MRGKIAGRIRHKTCSFSLAIRIFALVTNKSLSRHCENRDTSTCASGIDGILFVFLAKIFQKLVNLGFTGVGQDFPGIGGPGTEEI